MAAESCTYRTVSYENQEAVLKAWFNGQASAEDMATFMNPSMVTEITLTKGDNKITLSPNFSLKPEWNTTFEYTIGEEVKFGAPWNCSAKVTCDGTTMKEVVKYADGAVYTYTSTFTGKGWTSKVHGADGYIGSSYAEMVDVGIDGFYVIESNENLAEYLSEDFNMPKSKALEMMEGMAWSMKETNGVYTSTDFLGDGATKSETFRLGEEYESTLPDGSNAQDCITIKTGPNTYKTTMKNKETGKVSTWNLEVTKDHGIFTVEKNLGTANAKATYRRYPNFLGNWKVVSLDNVDAGMKLVGVPQPMIDNLMAERATHTFKYLGKGRYSWCHDSKVLKTEPIVYKNGEEFSFDMQGYSGTEIVHFTRTGFVGAQTMGGKTNKFKLTVGKTYMSEEIEYVGHPETKAIVLMVRA